MNFIFRTFADGDRDGILKTYTAAFCNSRMCQPSTPEFWEWKYGANRPHYAPTGYQICEYKGRVVGSIMCTIRTMKFERTVFKAAGIDDVATCPVLEKRGIGKRLMENAVSFMEEEQKVDLSILAADPRGHAKKVYWRAGYKHTTFFSVGFKVISFRNTLTNFAPVIPLAAPLRLYGAFRSRSSVKKYQGQLSFEILGNDQTQFREKINENNRIFHSFNDFSPEYWRWYHIERPKGYESIVVAVKVDDKIVAGGVITRVFLMIFNSRKWYPIYLLTELFVEKEYQGRGIGGYLLKQLEDLARQRGVALILVHFHGRNNAFRALIRKNGYIYMNKTTLQMIKPISDRAKDYFSSIEGKKFIWKVPWEQLGY